ncbi:hypothetical protein C5167_018876 [Papaver somniferum]|uniref:Methyltransferase type 11 domain-containing protein n=1 Tax=Papaver somniferum TaxID=3469 RepID=A0A4Y7ISM9_PAPSO|nr:hypothetical protein C5167_018876 [Papaver somniferum]
MASASLHRINSFNYIGFPTYPSSSISTSTSLLVFPKKSPSKICATSSTIPLQTCQKCNKSYSSKDIYLDLTITYGSKNYTESYPTRTELFRNPLVSFLYERGWRQNFSQSGFPGPDEEFKMAQEYFKPAEGGLLVDVSCGSGLFSRKFVKSGTYSGVIGLDFSENMLRQCYDLLIKDETILNPNLALVRADVSRLPFSSGSVDAVHAGAALHCWPSPSNAVSNSSLPNFFAENFISYLAKRWSLCRNHIFEFFFWQLGFFSDIETLQTGCRLVAVISRIYRQCGLVFYRAAKGLANHGNSMAELRDIREGLTLVHKLQKFREECATGVLTTGAPENHSFGPAGEPRGSVFGTPGALKLVWSCHRETVYDVGPVPHIWSKIKFSLVGGWTVIRLLAKLRNKLRDSQLIKYHYRALECQSG